MESEDLELYDIGGAMEEEKRPGELLAVGRSDEIAGDYLTVKHTGPDNGERFFQAENPAPRNRIAYNFEALIKHAGEKGEITIGFSKEHGREKGVEHYGYTSNTGVIYGQDDQDVVFGQTFTTNDIVGCGIDGVSHDIFSRSIRRQLSHPLYPTIALHNPNEEVSVNFGQMGFSFDFEKFEASLRDKKDMEIEKISLSRSISQGLVKTYLHHYGYEDSFRAFTLAASKVPPTDVAQEAGFDEYELHLRKHLRELIMTAEIDAASAELENRFPQLIEVGSEVYFVLVCQNIIELVRKGARAEANTYAKEKNLEDLRDSYQLKKLFDGCKALLECETVDAADLLGETHKARVADFINEAVLATNPQYNPTSLEQVLRQVGATCALYRC